MSSFILGIGVGCGAMSFLAVYALWCWRDERACRVEATRQLLDTIDELRPLADIGRKVRAVRARSDAKRRAA